FRVRSFFLQAALLLSGAVLFWRMTVSESPVTLFAWTIPLSLASYVAGGLLWVFLWTVAATVGAFFGVFLTDFLAEKAFYVAQTGLLWLVFWWVCRIEWERQRTANRLEEEKDDLEIAVANFLASNDKQLASIANAQERREVYRRLQ